MSEEDKHVVRRNGYHESLRKPSKLLSTAVSYQFLQLIKGLHVTSNMVLEVGHRGKGSGLEGGMGGSGLLFAGLKLEMTSHLMGSV